MESFFVGAYPRSNTSRFVQLRVGTVVSAYIERVLTRPAHNRCSDGTLSSKPQNHGAQDCPPSVDNDKLDMTSAP